MEGRDPRDVQLTAVNNNCDESSVCVCASNVCQFSEIMNESGCVCPNV